MITAPPPARPIHSFAPEVSRRLAVGSFAVVLGLLTATAVILRRWWADAQDMLVTDNAPTWSALLAAAGAVSAGALVLRAFGDPTTARSYDGVVTWSAAAWVGGTGTWLLITLSQLAAVEVWQLPTVENLVAVAAASRLASAQVVVVWIGLVIMVLGRRLTGRAETLATATVALAGLVAVGPSPILRSHESGQGHQVVLAAAGLELAAASLIVGCLVVAAWVLIRDRRRPDRVPGLAAVPGLNAVLTGAPLVIALAVLTGRVVRNEIALFVSVSGQLVLLQLAVVIVVAVVARRHRSRPQLQPGGGVRAVALALGTEVLLATVIVTVAWLAPIAL